MKNASWGRRVAVGTVALGTLGMVASAVPASASPSTRHCAVDLSTGRTGCGTDMADAARQAGVGPQAVLAVTLYDGFNFTAKLGDLYVPKACTPGYDGEYGVGDLGSYSNRASSVKTHNRCDVRLHDPINYGTPYSTFIHEAANLSTIGAGWNNRASSMGIS